MRWVSGSATRELAPLWGAGLRFALAAALLLAVMVVFSLAFPWGRVLIGSLLYGLFNFAGSFGLTYYGLVQVHAGLGQICWRWCHWPRCCSRCSGGRSGSVRPQSSELFSLSLGS
jgi:hypothetical protein